MKRPTPGQEMAVMGMLMGNKRKATYTEVRADRLEQSVGNTAVKFRKRRAGSEML